MNASECKICRNSNGTNCITLQSRSDRDASQFECGSCGRYEITRQALVNHFGDQATLTKMDRANFSYRIRNSATERCLTSEWCDGVIAGPQLPRPPMQTANMVRAIGDHYSKTGDAMPVDSSTIVAQIGCLDQRSFDEIWDEMKSAGIAKNSTIPLVPIPNPRGRDYSMAACLTSSGWKLYEDECRGRSSSMDCFIAMKFGEEQLNTLVRDIMKPAIKEEFGYNLYSLDDVPRAGIIDNILRQQIRNSAFVIVDLTHDNSGAYWEAGYAEGLSKPVIYICEKRKFKKQQTHFDTNHCTTVMWDCSDYSHFSKSLIATIRRSIVN